MMKHAKDIKRVMIKDKSSGIYFTFMRQFPGICAQGNTEEEARQKLDKNARIYFDYAAKRANEEEYAF